MDRSLEQQVYTLLSLRDFPGLLDLCEKDRRSWRILWASLYDANERLRWPAIEAVARVMDRWWQAGHRERVQEYVRRLIWSLSDEAGEMGWSAPQTIAEVVVSIPELLEPYGSVMVCRAFEEPAMVTGGLWGIGRLGRRIKEAVESFQDSVLGVFESQDPETLGLAAWAMGEVNFKSALPYLEKLKGRKKPARIYIDGHFDEKAVGQWAQEAVAKIDTHPMAR